jgi:coproporphyrinogen III oxidase
VNSDPTSPEKVASVEAYLMALQDQICAALEQEEGAEHFREDRLEGDGGALSRTRVLEDGAVIERAAVNFTHARGDRLPPAATERRPELAGSGFRAVSLSLIVHPRNPYAPTTHANLRFFCAGPPAGEGVWWFGGGFDLTPYYGFEEDALHWHRTARDACTCLDPRSYERFKKQCDEYFFLKHRGETRGIGGLFFDDLCEGGFERCFGFLCSVGDHFLPAYRPILQRRKGMPHGQRERDFQLYRRGRYVEFNLVYDRGTRYGLQSGRRIESVLASLPPEVRWRYDWRPEPGSEEARLYQEFLKPRDWLADD